MALLSRLEKVRQTGRGRWIACCPAHPDKTPSLTIAECDDGRVLAHCFSGCGFDAIVDAIGISVEEFFPEKPLYQRGKPLRRQFPAGDVLECLRFEATIAQVALSDMSQGKALSEADKTRLGLAAQRIRDAVELVNG